MNRNLLASVSTLALLLGAASAQAADLGRPITKAPAMVAAPAYAGWTGFYIGGQVGYQYGYFRETDFFANTGFNTGFARSYNPDGIVGGGHVGFNFQTGMFVLGIEADAEASGVRGTVGFAGGNTKFDQRWQSSFRGRVGFTVGNAALIYATGGAAFSDLRFTYNNFVSNRSEVFTGTTTGYTVGAGIEWMFAPAWSARAEYRYTDFGTVNDTNAFAFPGITARQRAEFSTVRLGVSYRFAGGGGPVVAAY